MIKVLHCLKLLIPGGVERLRMSMFRRLPEGEYDHRIICTEIGDAAYAEEMLRYVSSIDEVGQVESVFSPGRYRHAARIVEDWNPDIIHGAIIEGYTLASVVGRLKSVPVVILEETSDPQNRRWKGHMLARAMAGLADHCIGVSPGVVRYLTDQLKVPSNKVSLLNNGVEQPAIPSKERIASIRAEFQLQEDDLVIGSVGRMEDETCKCFGDLIRCLQSLHDIPNAKLLLVGDGPEREGLERLANELNVRERVVFAGFQFHVGHFYALMDVFALASAREAFGLVNAEAMRCGLPVVATAVGGIPDVVVDGETGFLVPPRDTDAMAAALRRVLMDKSLQWRLGTAGKIRADREFSAERYVEDVHQLYERLLAEKKK